VASFPLQQEVLYNFQYIATKEKGAISLQGIEANGFGNENRVHSSKEGINLSVRLSMYTKNIS